jgi:hypothetical protein
MIESHLAPLSLPLESTPSISFSTSVTRFHNDSRLSLSVFYPRLTQRLSKSYLFLSRKVWACAFFAVAAPVPDSPA